MQSLNQSKIATMAASTTTHRYIIDTDGGVDDAFALLLALRSPDMPLEAITTVRPSIGKQSRKLSVLFLLLFGSQVAGNVTVEQATKNVLFILEFFKLHRRKGDEMDSSNPIPPVYIGASAPLTRPLYVATHIHGTDGLGNVTVKHRAIPRRQKSGEFPAPRSLATFEEDMAELLAATDREYHRITSDISRKSAVDAIIEIVARNPPDSVTIVTIGPMTNVAMATRLNPTVMSKVKSVIAMGGAFETYGNVTLAAEYNCWVDPEAVRVCLGIGSSPVNPPTSDRVAITTGGTHKVDLPLPKLVFVPLDVTHKVPFGEAELSPYLGTSVVAKFFDEITSFIRFEFNTKDGNGAVMHMHDPLAVAVAIDPSLTTRVPTMVSVECESAIMRGKTLADCRKRPLFNTNEVNALVCVDVDTARFWKIWNARVME